MKQTCIQLVIFCTMLNCSAQTTVFKGQLWNNNSAVKNYTVYIDGSSATTNDAGVFVLPVKNSATQVTIQPSENKYIIIYPIGGKALIPKDASMITQIVVEPFQANKYIGEYLVQFKQLKDSAGKSQAELKAVHQQINTITQLLYKFNYTSEDLKNAREREDGIDIFYPEISLALQSYVMQARNVCSAFKYVSDYAFDNHTALEQLVQAINNYNPAFNVLFTNHNLYSQKIQTYWQDPALKSAFDGIADTLLNNIHKQTIFPLNDLKTSINQYFIGQVSSNDKPAAKKSIQNQIAQIVPKLNDEITQMESRVQVFQNQLKK